MAFSMMGGDGANLNLGHSSQRQKRASGRSYKESVRQTLWKRTQQLSGCVSVQSSTLAQASAARRNLEGRWFVRLGYFLDRVWRKLRGKG